MNAGLRSLLRPLLYIVLFNLLPQIQLRAGWITLFSFALVGFRLWLDYSGSRPPPRWAIFILQFAAGLAIWQNYHSFLGDEAGGAFLTLLTCLKVYELRRPRDFFITGTLCLLVLMSYMLIDQGLTMTLFMLADLAMLVTFFYSLQREEWSWKIWREAAKPSIALILKSVPLVVLMFVLFPRFNTGFGHSGNSAGKTGVTDSLKPGSVASLVASDELIFRASFLDGIAPPRSQLYWRGAVLDQSHGMNWDRSEAPPGAKVRTQPMGASPDLEVYLEPGNDKFLFSLDGTRSLAFPNSSAFRVRPRAGGTYELTEPLQTRERYYIQREDAGAKEPAEDLEKYLKVGEKASPELAEFLRKYEKMPPREAIQALLENYRTGGYRYSLRPPPSATLDEFLFKNKVGFCEHFAGTTATLLRHLKIPSRVIVGFQGGSTSFFENYISVRGHDAHSWVEYWDQAASRWRRLDPTSEVEPLRVSQGSVTYMQENRNFLPSWVPAGWTRSYLRSRDFVDEVEANWTGFLLRFDLARQKELLAKLGMEEVLFRALGVFLLLSVGLILAVLYFFEAQRREPLTPDEKIYRQLVNVLKKWRIRKTAQEGPLTLFERVRSEQPGLAIQVEPILAPLVRARYGREKLSPRTLQELKRRLRRLRRSR